MSAEMWELGLRVLLRSYILKALPVPPLNCLFAIRQSLLVVGIHLPYYSLRFHPLVGLRKRYRVRVLNR